MVKTTKCPSRNYIKVDYEKFRVFGCQVYFYIPKQFRRKFNGTSLPGIFLGYDDNNPTAYIIYDTIIK